MTLKGITQETDKAIHKIHGFFLLQVLVTRKTDSTTGAQVANQSDGCGKGVSVTCSRNTGPLHGVKTQLTATKSFHFRLRVYSEEDTVDICSHELSSGNSPNWPSVCNPQKTGRTTVSCCHT